MLRQTCHSDARFSAGVSSERALEIAGLEIPAWPSVEMKSP
jgi:hypothetical protein